MVRKAIYFLIFLSLFLSPNKSAYAQAGWYWQNPRPQGNQLFSIASLNETKAIAVGGGGAYIETTNSGEKWINKNVNNVLTTKNVTFINGETGFLFRDDNKLLKTTNGGNNWYVVFENGNNIRSIKFINNDIGLFLDGNYSIYKTTSGGNNWFLFAAFTSPQITYLYDIAFLNENVIKCLGKRDAFIGYTQGIMQTSNGGLNWSYVSASIPSSYWNNIHFVNSQTGFISGRGGVVSKTTNSGNTWVTLNTGLNSEYDLKKILFYNERIGIVKSDNTRGILFTTNSGNNWQFVSIAIDDFCYMDSTTLIATGHLGAIYKSTNSGLNWISKLNSITSTRLITSYCFSDKIFYVGGVDGVIVKTTNGGSSWFKQESGLSDNRLGTPSTVCGIHFVNENTGMALTHTHILKTTNGGSNWNIIISNDSASFKSIYMINENDAFLIGSNGVFSKTTNGGTNWTQVIQNNRDYVSITFANKSTGYILASPSIIYKTTNSGMQWTEQSGFAGNNIYFLNENTGFILDPYGPIYRTTNGSINWETIQLNTGSILNDLTFTNEKTGYIVGHLSTVLLKTTNGGLNWNLEPTGLHYDAGWLWGISSYGGNAIFVGENGIIKSTDSNTSVFINTNSHSNTTYHYSLHQNYPNPFNPTTKINFEIPKSGYVTLIVYDLLGREMTRLINNEFRNSGVYEAIFDGSNFASCVYFYQLIAGESVYTKKMLLIK
ncbi:MAG TPA: YCF48-related protein [Ignavibacteria bacterium]|nr:YCF48-related protein [Ignavibacteria bacterium]